MTNYSNQDFSAQSFGEPVENRRGGRAFLFSCGGLSLVGFLICCCCAAVVIWGARRPEAVVTFWGTGAQSDWSFADRFVCEGSNADVLTQRYNELEVRIEGLQPQSAAEGQENTIVAKGTLNYQGEAHNWEATFYLSDRGKRSEEWPDFVQLCINNIDVTQGDIVGGVDIDNPTVDEENPEADEENATPDE